MPISYTPSLALLKPAAAVQIPSIHKNKRIYLSGVVLKMQIYLRSSQSLSSHKNKRSKKMSKDIFFFVFRTTTDKSIYRAWY